MTRLRLRSQLAAYLHSHEGVKRLQVDDFEIENSDHSGQCPDVINVVGRAYDNVFQNGVVRAAASGAIGGTAITVDQTCIPSLGHSVRVGNIHMDLTNMTGAIRDDAGSLVKMGPITFGGSVNRMSLRGFQRSAPYGNLVSGEYFVVVVSFDKPSVTLNVLPQQGAVLEVFGIGETTFNAGATNKWSVGWSGNTGALVDTVDCPAAGAVKRVLVGDTVQANGAGAQLGIVQASSSRTLLVTYAQTGGAATAGRMQVFARWVVGPRVD